MPNDLALIGIGIDPKGSEAGARQVNSALDSVVKKANEVIAQVRNIGRQVEDALRITGGASNTSRIETDLQRIQSKITQVASSEQQKRETNEARHQQKLVEIAQASAAKKAEIEGRKVAQLEAIQERSAQREIDRQKHIQQQAAARADTDALRAAQASARIQQQLGNTQGAISILASAIEKTSDKSSLPALRAELQKTYLETNYANSPLIGAIRQISEGLSRLAPVLGSAGSGLQKIVGVTGAAAQAFARSGQAAEAASGGVSRFSGFLDQAREVAQKFAGDEGGSASLTTALLNISRLASQAGEKVRSAYSSIRQGQNPFAGLFGGAKAPTSEVSLSGLVADTSKAETGLKAVEAAASGTGRSVAGIGAVAGIALGSILALVAGALLLYGAGKAAEYLASGLQRIAVVGIQANSQFEQVRLGIASVTASVGKLRDGQGVELKGIDALNAALPIAQKQLDALRVDALQTSLTFQQIAPAFLQAVGPGLAAGLNLDQVRKTVVDISQLIVPLTGDAGQLGQELRSIFSGDIGPDSGVARALQITREQIEAAKQAGKFAEFLNEKLKVAAATGKLMAQTFEAASSNLQEAGTVLSSQVTKGLFDALKNQINALLPQIFDTAGGKVNIAPAFSGIADTLTQIFNRAGEAASSFITFVINGIKSVSAFLTENQKEVRSIIDGVFEIGRAIGSIIASVIRLVAAFAGADASVATVESSVQSVAKALTATAYIVEKLVKLLTTVSDILNAGGILSAVARLSTFGGLGFAIENISNLLGGYKTQQTAAAASTENTTGFVLQQAGAINSLGAALKNLDIGNAKKLVDERIAEIAKRAKTVAEARALYRKELALNDDFNAAVNFTKRVDANTTGINDLRSPRKTGGGRSSESEQKAISDALIQQRKVQADNIVRIAKDENDRELRQIQALYDAGLLTAGEFYRDKAGLQAASIGNEINLIQQEIVETSRLFEAAKKTGAEKIRLGADLDRLRTDLILKTRSLTDVEVENLRAIEEANKKAVAALNEVSLARNYEPPKLLEDVKQKTGELLNLFPKLKKELADLEGLIYGRSGANTFRKADFEEAKLRREVAEIQNAINLGVLTEVEGRRAILDIEAQHRDALLKALEAEARFHELQGDKVEAERLREKIVQYHSLGVELTNTQRLLKGLADTESIGDQFEKLGQDIRGTMRNAFQAAFEEGPKGFFREMLNGFKRTLAQLASELLTSQFVRLLRNLFGQSQQGNAGSSAQGGQTGNVISTLRNVFTGGGGGSGGVNIPGITSPGGQNLGQFATGGFAGGNPAQQILNGGSGGGGLPSLLQRIPLLGRLFGGGASGVAGSAGATTEASGAVAAAKAAANGGTAAAGGAGALASLGATGLLTGGFIGGQFLGGNSQIGRLLGGAGGALGIGALASTGIFGSGIASLLPAFFTNPITAIIGGALLGGALLFRLLGNRDFKKFSSEVNSAYQVKVENDKEGKQLFEQAKAYGEAAFGKGQFKNKIAETIRIEDVKKLIAAYGESTGQTQSELVKRAIATREIGSETSAANRFIRRAFGGDVFTGQPFIAGDGGRPEVVVPKTNGVVFPSIADFQRQLLTEAAKSLGGIFGGIRQKLLAQLSGGSDGAGEPTRIQADEGGMLRVIHGLSVAVAELTEEVATFRATPADSIIEKRLSQRPGLVTNALSNGLAGNPAAKQQLQRDLGVA